MATINSTDKDGNRRRSFDQHNDGVQVVAVVTPADAAKRPKIATTKIYTFRSGSAPSPVEVEVLSTNKLNEVVDVFRKIFQLPGAREELWGIFAGGSDSSRSVVTYRRGPSKRISLERAERELPGHAMLVAVILEYGTREHQYEFRVSGIQEVKESAIDIRDFPRRKPFAVAPVSGLFATNGLNLNVIFPSVNNWCFHHNEGIKELNFFQAGRKHVHAYLETHQMQMIMMPDKASSLTHYLQCLRAAAIVPRATYVGHPTYNWHSIVVVPKNPGKPLPKRLGAFTFRQRLEAGFCDCRILNPLGGTPDVDAVFPKLAAFAGFQKDPRMKVKGWIRYTNNVLWVCTGSGSPCGHPKSPKGTAFQGEGTHIPAFPASDILFRVNRKFQSLHELFCEVEGLLRTL